MTASRRSKRILLRIWRDVPFPAWLRRLFLQVINPRFMVGAMALIQDEQGRVLLLEHTYRRRAPWGLPGGWLKRAESPEAGLAREVFEETGLEVAVEQLLAADFYEDAQLDLLYRCRIVSGAYHATDETSSHRWVAVSALPELLPNQRHMLDKLGLVDDPGPTTRAPRG